MSFLDKYKIIRGTFSPAGKASEEKYNIKNQANKVLNKEKKKYVKDFFTPDKDWEDDGLEEDEKIYIFEEMNGYKSQSQREKIKRDIKEYFKEHILKSNTPNKKKKKLKFNFNIKKKRKDLSGYFSSKNKKIKLNKAKNVTCDNFYIKGVYSPLNENKYKYHNSHLKRLLQEYKSKKFKLNYKNNEPIYYPKMEYLYNKINVGPKWEKILGRTNSLIKESEKTLDNYYTKELNKLNINHNSFIDMSKQTQRKGFPINNNLRQRYETKYVPLEEKKENMINKKLHKKPLISKSPFSRDKFDYKIKKILGLDKKLYTSYNLFKDKNISFEKVKSVPDFSKCLSREYLKKLDNNCLIESNDLLNPKYDSIEERIKMMVIYSRNKKENIKINKKFKGIESNDLFNATEAFEKNYGHKFKKAPNFEKSSSRLTDKTLPCFMKGIYNKLSSNFITEKSLKLNNYSNRDMQYNINENHPNTSRFKNSDEDITFFENKNEIDIFDKENDLDIQVNNINDKNNIRTKKMKKEMLETIKKMNKLYYDFRNNIKH